MLSAFRMSNKSCMREFKRSFQSSRLIQGGGGGGRPGGMPTFSWKQKKILQIQKKKVVKAIPDYGNIELLGDLSKYKKIDLSVVENYEDVIPSEMPVAESDAAETIAHNKTIKTSLLFGSHKPAYAIPLRGNPDKRGNLKRKVKLTFSHRRIFGHKMKKAEVSA